MKERILIKTNIVFPLLSHPDNSRKVFIFFSQRKKYYSIFLLSKYLYFFRPYQIVSYFILLGNSNFVKIDC